MVCLGNHPKSLCSKNIWISWCNGNFIFLFCSRVHCQNFLPLYIYFFFNYLFDCFSSISSYCSVMSVFWQQNCSLWIIYEQLLMNFNTLRYIILVLITLSILPHHSDMIPLVVHTQTAVIFLWCKDKSSLFLIVLQRYWCFLYNRSAWLYFLKSKDLAITT